MKTVLSKISLSMLDSNYDSTPYYCSHFNVEPPALKFILNYCNGLFSPRWCLSLVHMLFRYWFVTYFERIMTEQREALLWLCVSLSMVLDLTELLVSTNLLYLT